MKYVVQNVSVYDGTINGKLIENTNVYVEDGKILLITPENIEGFEVIDGTNKFLIPGLINLNHKIQLSKLSGLNSWISKKEYTHKLRKLLKEGITTVVLEEDLNYTGNAVKDEKHIPECLLCPHINKYAFKENMIDDLLDREYNYFHLNHTDNDLIDKLHDHHCTVISTYDYEFTHADMVDNFKPFGDDMASHLKNNTIGVITQLSKLEPSESLNELVGVSKLLSYYIPCGMGSDKSFIDEMMLFQYTYELSNAFILYTVTLQSAYMLHKENEIGSIEMGKKAHMILCDENPLNDLNALRKISYVFLNDQIIKK